MNIHVQCQVKTWVWGVWTEVPRDMVGEEEEAAEIFQEDDMSLFHPDPETYKNFRTLKYTFDILTIFIYFYFMNIVVSPSCSLG